MSTDLQEKYAVGQQQPPWNVMEMQRQLEKPNQQDIEKFKTATKGTENSSNDEKQKMQGEIASLITQIQQLTQQLKVMDSKPQTTNSQASQGASPEGSPAAGNSPERIALVTQIQQLTQQLQALQANL